MKEIPFTCDQSKMDEWIETQREIMNSFNGAQDEIISAIEMKDTNVSKDTNPKDSVGVKKVPMSTVPTQVIMEVGLAMLEGARKYGRHNYRVAGVRSSVYYDALQRHINQWWEGEDVDPESGLNHITKAISTLVVLRDAMLNDKLTDDRPPSVKNQDWVRDYNKKAEEIISKYPNALSAYVRGSEIL